MTAVLSVWLPAWLTVLEVKFEIYTLKCAPSRTRTCGLLLRRQLLYPLSYRGHHEPTWTDQRPGQA